METYNLASGVKKIKKENINSIKQYSINKSFTFKYHIASVSV